jgi:hypothetical protein
MRALNFQLCRMRHRMAELSRWAPHGAGRSMGSCCNMSRTWLCSSAGFLQPACYCMLLSKHWGVLHASYVHAVQLQPSSRRSMSVLPLRHLLRLYQQHHNLWGASAVTLNPSGFQGVLSYLEAAHVTLAYARPKALVFRPGEG